MARNAMNCERCGRFVTRKTCGDYDIERSDLDGARCIVAMWCKLCAKKRKTVDNAGRG